MNVTMLDTLTVFATGFSFTCGCMAAYWCVKTVCKLIFTAIQQYALWKYRRKVAAATKVN